MYAYCLCEDECVREQRARYATPKALYTHMHDFPSFASRKEQLQALFYERTILFAAGGTCGVGSVCISA